jgi:RNA methyltransferase, TrmH family
MRAELRGPWAYGRTRTAVMASEPSIRSAANPALKKVGAVLAGKEPGLLVLEGERLLEDARRAGVRFESVFVSEEREALASELEALELPVRRVAAELLKRTGSLKSSPGVLALCQVPQAPARESLRAGPEALVLVVVGMQDPGNLGALARSAEAAGADALVIAGPTVSPWNEKALRGSMGSLLRLPVHTFASAEEVVRELAQRGFRQVCAATRGGTDLAHFDGRGPIALWIGGETGALPEAAQRCERVTIPMAGRVESLNVTVAASLLLFACGRSRRREP